MNKERQYVIKYEEELAKTERKLFGDWFHMATNQKAWLSGNPAAPVAMVTHSPRGKFVASPVRPPGASPGKQKIVAGRQVSCS